MQEELSFCRLTIKASCQMDLSDFPMDKQRCPLQIGSCELRPQKWALFSNSLLHFSPVELTLLFPVTQCCSWREEDPPQLTPLLKATHAHTHTRFVFFISVGYTKEELFYQWMSGRGVNIASDMKLSQFDLMSTPTGNATITVNRGMEYDMKERPFQKHFLRSLLDLSLSPAMDSYKESSLPLPPPPFPPSLPPSSADKAI